jgi:hypothetical protein
MIPFRIAHHRELPETRPSRRLPTQRRRRSGPSDISRIRSPPCGGASPLTLTRSLQRCPCCNAPRKPTTARQHLWRRKTNSLLQHRWRDKDDQQDCVLLPGHAEERRSAPSPLASPRPMNLPECRTVYETKGENTLWLAADRCPNRQPVSKRCRRVRPPHAWSPGARPKTPLT